MTRVGSPGGDAFPGAPVGEGPGAGACRSVALALTSQRAEAAFVKRKNRDANRPPRPNSSAAPPRRAAGAKTKYRLPGALGPRGR